MTNINIDLRCLSVSEFVEVCKVVRRDYRGNLLPAMDVYYRNNASHNFQGIYVIGDKNDNIIKNEDLSNIDLSYVVFINTEFIDCNLHNTNFYQCSFRKTNFTNCTGEKKLDNSRQILYKNKSYILEEGAGAVKDHLQDQILSTMLKNDAARMRKLFKEIESRSFKEKFIDCCKSFYSIMMPKGLMITSIIAGMIIGIKKGLIKGLTCMILGVIATMGVHLILHFKFSMAEFLNFYTPLSWILKKTPFISKMVDKVMKKNNVMGMRVDGVDDVDGNANYRNNEDIQHNAAERAV